MYLSCQLKENILKILKVWEMYDKNLKTFIIAMLKYFVLWVTYMIYLYALFCKIWF